MTTDRHRPGDDGALAYQAGLDALTRGGGEYTLMESVTVATVAARLWIGEAAAQLVRDAGVPPEEAVRQVVAAAAGDETQALIVQMVKENVPCPPRH